MLDCLKMIIHRISSCMIITLDAFTLLQRLDNGYNTALVKDFFILFLLLRQKQRVRRIQLILFGFRDDMTSECRVVDCIPMIMI